ncbi:kinase [Nocardia beijingensis]|uniref:kinase n=1 Tax=Nocardia beijingensis TaxID=95162 RepID=UPI0033FCED39
MTTASEFERLSEAGELIWMNERYAARYGIDRPGLNSQLGARQIPVVHAGQPEVIWAVTQATPEVRWSVVELRCSRDVARARIIARDTGDTAARLQAWDSTPLLRAADLTIRTDTVSPEEAAQSIRALVLGSNRTPTD